LLAVIHSYEVLIADPLFPQPTRSNSFWLDINCLCFSCRSRCLLISYNIFCRRIFNGIAILNEDPLLSLCKKKNTYIHKRLSNQDNFIFHFILFLHACHHKLELVTWWIN